MVKIRRAYEALFLGLFLLLSVHHRSALSQGMAGVALSRSHAAGRRCDRADDAHDLPQSGLGPGDHRHHHDAGASLVQLDVPVRHSAPFLRLDRQSPQHQADDRGQSISQDLCDQVLHPGSDDRDGQPVDHPHCNRRPRANLGAYQGAELRQTGVSRVVAAVETGIARSAEEHKRNNSTLQIGLLDPIALTVRSMTTSVLPSVHKATESVYTEPREYWQAWIVGLVFIGFLVANWWIPPFFCRVVCPLGALLGIFSKFALWRIDRDPVRCTDCDLCLKSCEGASDPQGDLRKSECFVCLNCIDDCPHDALSFRFLPRKASEVAYPAVGRRELVLSGLFGLALLPDGPAFRGRA